MKGWMKVKFKCGCTRTVREYTANRFKAKWEAMPCAKCDGKHTISIKDKEIIGKQSHILNSNLLKGEQHHA